MCQWSTVTKNNTQFRDVKRLERLPLLERTAQTLDHISAQTMREKVRSIRARTSCHNKELQGARLHIESALHHVLCITDLSGRRIDAFQRGKFGNGVEVLAVGVREPALGAHHVALDDDCFVAAFVSLGSLDTVVREGKQNEG